jgi:hypothetical protein
MLNKVPADQATAIMDIFIHGIEHKPAAVKRNRFCH